MASEVVTFEDLARFHREVIVPDIERIVADKVGAEFDRRLPPLAGEIASLREDLGEVRGEVVELRHDMLTHFDAVYTRLDSMAVEQVALKGGLRRLEDRVTKLERKIS